jgi:hypothetical protein
MQTMDTKHPTQLFYVWLVDPHNICTKHGLEAWFSRNNDIRIYLLDINHSRTKNAFWDVSNTKWRKWCKFVSPFLFNNNYGLSALTTHTKWPNEVLYVLLDDFHTICAKQELEKRLSPNNEIRICLLVIFQLKTRLEMWITGNYVHGVTLFYLSYIITLMAYQSSQWTTND